MKIEIKKAQDLIAFNFNLFFFDDRIFFVVPFGQVSCGCGG
jgi:hypothetical protein